MKKRKTISIKLVESNDVAERQRRCRDEGAKSGKSQKPLYLTVEQVEMLAELCKISKAGNQQDTINNAIKIALLHRTGKLWQMPEWFSWRIKIKLWLKAFPLLRVKHVNVNSTGKKVRKTFDMTLEQQSYLNKLQEAMDSTNQQAVLIRALQISLDYYSGKIYFPKSFTCWQKFLIWIKIGVRI